MKKHYLVFAILCPLAATSHAQSSVTLYGLIDEGFEAVNNVSVPGKTGGQTKFGLDSVNGLNGTRWGLRGTEDLGGGLSAVFTLENGFDLNTGKLGQGGDEFGRQAFVGISSKQLGTVTVGRQYDSVVDFVGGLEFGDSSVGTAHSAHPGDLDNFNNTRHTNNAIKFTSPNFSGLTFGGLYSFGGTPGSIATDQVYSLGVAYAKGPLSVGAAYLNARNPAASLFGSNPSDTATSNGLTGTPVFSGYVTARSYQVSGAGGSYALGPAIFGATFSNVRFGNIGQLGGTTAAFNDAEASFQYHMTPRLLAGVAYNYTRGSEVTSRVGGANYNQFTLGANYSLSKRTDVYTAIIYQAVSGRDSTGGAAVADINGVSSSTNQQQAVARIGLRTRF
jgi:predicted porin